MQNLSLNYLFSTIVVLLTIFLVPGLVLETPLNVILSCLILGFVNFLIRPMLLITRRKILTDELAIFAFVINLLILNLANGLMDDFDYTGLIAALFGSILLAIFQLGLNGLEARRGKIIT
jgi:putative membrane protein